MERHLERSRVSFTELVTCHQGSLTLCSPEVVEQQLFFIRFILQEAPTQLELSLFLYLLLQFLFLLVRQVVGIKYSRELLIYFLIYLVDAIGRGYLASSEIRLMIVITTTIVVLGLLCLMVCKFLLRFRIREIVNKSIIDNIREL